MAGLRATDGATCGNPEEVTLSIPVVYLTQGVQRPAGDVPLIRGGDALLCVFLKSEEPGAFFEPEVAATRSVGGEEVQRVVMRRDTDLLARISHTVTGESLSGGFGAEFLPRERVEQEQAALRPCFRGPRVAKIAG